MCAIARWQPIDASAGQQQHHHKGPDDYHDDDNAVVRFRRLKGTAWLRCRLSGERFAQHGRPPRICRGIQPGSGRRWPGPELQTDGIRCIRTREDSKGHGQGSIQDGVSRVVRQGLFERIQGRIAVPAGLTDSRRGPTICRPFFVGQEQLSVCGPPNREAMWQQEQTHRELSSGLFPPSHGKMRTEGAG